jgi:hypothetical protein
MIAMTMSWATRRVCACTSIYARRTSTFSTKSMNPIVGILQLFMMTKSIVIQKRSHKDFYSVDSGGSLLKRDYHTKE